MPSSVEFRWRCRRSRSASRRQVYGPWRRAVRYTASCCTPSVARELMPDVLPLRRALPLFLLAGLCLSSHDATAKYLVRDHALFLVVWARYAGQMLVATPFAWQRGGDGFWRTRKLALQLARSTLLLIATVFFFAALRYVPLAEGS